LFGAAALLASSLAVSNVQYRDDCSEAAMDRANPLRRQQAQLDDLDDAVGAEPASFEELFRLRLPAWSTSLKFHLTPAPRIVAFVSRIAYGIGPQQASPSLCYEGASMRGSAVAVALLLAALAAAGCSVGTEGDVSTARRRAGEYLSALVGGAADHGWSLILPDSRRAYASREQYIELAQQTEWTRFSWRFVDEGHYCQDGGVYCVVRIEVDEAPGAIPDFLLAAPQSRDDDTLRTLLFDDDAASPGNAEIVVYFTAGGPSGISLGGG
jgi:hypothetical protein